jgi:acyl carrier protein
MTRDSIQSVVIKHLCNLVEGVDPTAIDTSRSMKDYGANSLDLVEVVSATMRELKVKVPRAALAKVTNIDGLVDLVWETAQGKQVA